MAIIEVLGVERKRLLSELAKVDKAIEMFGGRASSGKRSSKATNGTRRAKRSSEATRVSKAAQGVRWAKQLKKGPAAVAAAEKELAGAQRALAASKNR
jgi:hypothetical protein